MAAPILRHYQNLMPAGNSTLFTVPTARALVISKILIAATGTSTTSTITLTAAGNWLITNLNLTQGQVYTETGVVMTAGEALVATTSASNIYALHVFGEEVDN
jgi:hypothetical protein